VLPELGVKGGKGFIQKEDPGFVDKGPGYGDPLFLPPRKLVGLLVGVFLELDKAEVFVNGGRYYRPGNMPDLQGKSDVFKNR
jgi:hypothetical protein